MQSISKWLDRSALIPKELGYPGKKEGLVLPCTAQGNTNPSFSPG